MKLFRILTGLLLLAAPAAASAQGASTFDLFYDATENETKAEDLPPGLVDFVIDQMRHWQTNGIVLTESWHRCTCCRTSYRYPAKH